MPPFFHRFFYSFFLFAVLLFTALMLRIAAPYLLPPYPTDIDFLSSKQDVLHLASWRWAFYLHISVSFLVILAGLTQFSNPVLKKNPRLHRQVGKIYVFTILFLSAPSGLLMAFYANGGLVGQVGFITLSLLWWVMTWKAYRTARSGNFVQHRIFMFRSYALSCSAVTLRLLMLVVGLLPLDLSYESVYQIAAWVSWLANLGIVEIYLKKDNFKKKFSF